MVGLPDDKWGEAVHAVMVLRSGQAADAKAMEDWCRERMAGFKRPRGYHFVGESEIPRTATGKIQHRVLRDRLEAPARPERRDCARLSSPVRRAGGRRLGGIDAPADNRAVPPVRNGSALA